MGFEVGPLRKPLTEMEEAHTTILKENMKTYGIY
jgi:4-hydroxy-tetrahydrodipicolinate synthase